MLLAPLLSLSLPLLIFVPSSHRRRSETPLFVDHPPFVELQFFLSIEQFFFLSKERNKRFARIKSINEVPKYANGNGLREKSGGAIKSGKEEGGRNGTRRVVADHTRVASVMGPCSRCDASPCLSGALDCQPRGLNFVFVEHNERSLSLSLCLSPLSNEDRESSRETVRERPIHRSHLLVRHLFWKRSPFPANLRANSIRAAPGS